MSILLTILGMLLIGLGAILALVSLVGYERREFLRANIVLAVGVIILIGGAVLVATN